MQVRWSLDAAQDLERIFTRINTESPDAAQRVVKSIYDRASALRIFPRGGRSGRIEGTRELPLPPLPFIIVYRLLAQEAVEIVNVIHGAQRWP